MLEPMVAAAARVKWEELTRSGQLWSEAQLRSYYDTFRARFGPDKLSSLDGEELLNTMHLHGNKDSLVYWLEFKDDDELPSVWFGGIGGGTALKFGLYRRNETGRWMTGSPQQQHEVTTDEAIQIARRHRDDLIQGSRLLEKLPENSTDADYRQLQQDLMRLASSVQDTAWGHKYFSLLHPSKLDDYHNPDYQRFHLVKLLEAPPEGDGRYLAAARFAVAARELGIPMHHLTTTLGSLHGRRPYRYWRLEVSDGSKAPSQRAATRDDAGVAITGLDLGDLSNLTYNQPSKNQLRALVEEKQPPALKPVGRAVQQLFYFVTLMAEGDLVIATSDSEVLAVGQIAGRYSFAPDSTFPHQRPVRWLSRERWKLPPVEANHQPVMAEIKDASALIEIERHLLNPVIEPPTEPPTRVIEVVKSTANPLVGLPARVEAVLARKGQLILYGPPGTGKTYWAELTARELVARASFKAEFGQLSEEQKAFVLGGRDGWRGLVRLCSFHPAYGYEDFLEGYRPELKNGQMAFERRDGVFKQLCVDARAKPEHSFYLIVDEINRGDIPRIFGELLTVIEKDKRGKSVILPLSGEAFSVPPNVYVIGTMNTADRSIALLDTALRRRFGFIELMPDSSVLGTAEVEGIPLGLWLEALNRRICEHVGRDARNLQVGHSYLLERGGPVGGFGSLARIVHEDLVPLLEEYCYEDYDTLGKILGTTLVDVPGQRIRHELFEPDKQDELVKALLAPCPEIVTALQATVNAESTGIEEDEGDEKAESGDGQ